MKKKHNIVVAFLKKKENFVVVFLKKKENFVVLFLKKKENFVVAFLKEKKDYCCRIHEDQIKCGHIREKARECYGRINEEENVVAFLEKKML
jgi:hypothetical protein